ncbi:endonuclease/exonuclease/phosphatase family protein [Novipirellula sp. SH528]|uniref:endonuclease/exonuclease/phosphatase family protein n=1 Tax=Novipirellula sp. SH528 TaxID=3454466 RepID=UPI003FA06821
MSRISADRTPGTSHSAASIRQLTRLMLLSSSIVLIALANASPIQAEDIGESLSVMTWNLEWFYDEMSGDNYSKLGQEKSAPNREAWEWKRDAVAKRIAEAKPTIAAFQEVENRRVLWYLTRALDRDFSVDYRESCLEGKDFFTEQDVGILYRHPADLLLQTQMDRSESQLSDKRFYDVTKHLMAVFQFPVGDQFERVSIVNVHLRSRPEGAPIRARQARLLHAWLQDSIDRGENLIVLGDFNSEEPANRLSVDSELAIVAGAETDSSQDDLIDLHRYLDPRVTGTHSIPGKHFDRILVSRPLIEDDPSRKDLVFQSIKVRADLNIQGTPDDPQRHWDHYWDIADDERDVSDHLPVIATFEVK